MIRAFCIPIGRLQRFSIMKIRKDQSCVYDNKYTVKSDVNKRLQWEGQSSTLARLHGSTISKIFAKH